MSATAFVALVYNEVVDTAFEFASIPRELIDHIEKVVSSPGAVADDPAKVEFSLAMIKAQRELQAAVNKYKSSPSCAEPLSSTSTSQTPPPWTA